MAFATNEEGQPFAFPYLICNGGFLSQRRTSKHSTTDFVRSMLLRKYENNYQGDCGAKCHHLPEITLFLFHRTYTLIRQIVP
jgi:hypothetical protein